MRAFSFIFFGLGFAILGASPSIAVEPAQDCVQPFTISNAGVYQEGDEVTLKAGSPTSAISPSFYYSWRIPGSSGAGDYRSNIAACNTSTIQIGQDLNPEPGNMVGPTKQGIMDLISLDPEAHYDLESHCVVSNFQPSPRVITIPLYDSVFFEEGKQNGAGLSLRVDAFLTVFILGLENNSILAQVTSKNARCRPPREVCTDGADNDGDELVDCQDAADCANDPACAPQ